ncbi:MAG: hypothetical protein KF878_09625 [Planctomycetes bacterium]|nr:hypothetical protein [Planctomycetota bacterium]
MSDGKLRELERRWRKTGSPDDEAAYLLERVRVGDLSRERLELAAYCGHEASTRALVPATHFESDWDPTLWPREFNAAAAYLGAHLCFHEWERWASERPASEEDTRLLRAGLNMVRDFLLHDPRDPMEPLQRMISLWVQVKGLWNQPCLAETPDLAASAAARAVSAAMQVVAGGIDWRPEQGWRALDLEREAWSLSVESLRLVQETSTAPEDLDRSLTAGLVSYALSDHLPPT